MNTIWHRILEMPCGSATGIEVTALAEADTAVTQLGVPLCARPLDPAGEYAVAVALHPSEAELAFHRARKQSPTGRTLFQVQPSAPVEAVFVPHGTRSPGSVIHAAIEWHGRHALAPMTYSFGPLPGGAAWERVAEAVLEVCEAAAHCETVVVLLENRDHMQVPVHAYGLGAQGTVLGEVLHRIYAGRLGKTVCLKFLVSPTGVIAGISGVNDARALPGVIEVRLEARPDQIVRHVTTMASRDAIGYVLGENAAAARAATGAIRFETSPFLRGLDV